MDDDNHDHNNANVPLVSGSSPLPKILFGGPSTKESLDPKPSQAPEEPEKPEGARLEDGWDMVIMVKIMVGARWAPTTYNYIGVIAQFISIGAHLVSGFFKFQWPSSKRC